MHFMTILVWSLSSLSSAMWAAHLPGWVEIVGRCRTHICLWGQPTECICPSVAAAAPNPPLPLWLLPCAALRPAMRANPSLGRGYVWEVCSCTSSRLTHTSPPPPLMLWPPTRERGEKVVGVDADLTLGKDNSTALQHKTVSEETLVRSLHDQFVILSIKYPRHLDYSVKQC